MVPAAVPPLPNALEKKLHHPQTPWKLSKDLFERVRTQKTTKVFRACEVLRNDPEFAFIGAYFLHQQPPGLEIKRAFCIHNPHHTAGFEAEIKNIDQQIDLAAFAPKWKQEDLIEERTKVIQRWKEFTKQFSPIEIDSGARIDEYIRPKVVPMWHGTSKEICESICSSNFTFFGKHGFSNPSINKTDKSASTDQGYFGSGIYFTNSAKYAAMYSPSKILLLAWVAMREPYPVISNVPHPNMGKDMQKLLGKEHYQNYNAHYIPVASTSPLDPTCMVYYPCYGNQTPAWDELVVFQASQTLPRFWIELGSIEIPKSLPPPVNSPEQPFLKYQEGAKKNDPEAEYQLGLCYLKGSGTPQNIKEAINLFQKAASKNHAKASYQLGVCCDEGTGLPKDPKEAFKFYEKAASKGLDMAQCALGACYFLGKGVVQDLTKAAEWYKKSADQGYPLAQYYFGSCLMNGKGVQKNTQEGIAFHLKAAEKGIVPAQYYLGVFYLYGTGVTQDQKQALFWFQKAADQGDKDAKTMVQKLKETVK